MTPFTSANIYSYVRCLFVILFLAISVLRSYGDDSIRPLSDFPVSDELALAVELYADGKGTPEGFEKAYVIFYQLAELGDPVAQYYCGHMHQYGRGVWLDYDLAWSYYERAASKFVGKAYGRMGYMANFGLGREKDMKTAAHFYKLAIPSDPKSMNCLAVNIIKGKIPGTDEMAVELFEQACAADDPDSLNSFGFYHVSRRIKNANSEYGLELLRRSADLGNLQAYVNLIAYRKSQVAELRSELVRTQKKIAKSLLAEVIYVYRRDGIEAGLHKLDDKNQIIVNHDLLWGNFFDEVWNEAQLRTGRDDREWSWRVFDWLYDADMARSEKQMDGVYFDPALLWNLVTAQSADGRMGLLLETRKKIESGFSAKRNISLTLRPSSDLQYGAPRLPRYDRFKMPVYQPWTADEDYNKFEMGKLIDVNGIWPLVSVAYIGINWRERLAYYAWLEKWVDAVAHDHNDEILKHHDYSQVVAQMSMGVGSLYGTLGFIDRELSYFQKPIDAQSKHYKSRMSHRARTEMALSRAEYGLPITDNLESLYELRRLRSESSIHNRSAPHRVDLAIAAKLRQEGNSTQADVLLQDTVRIARNERFFMLHMRALRMCILWSLEDRHLDRCEADLLELLSLYREKGFKFGESGLYHRYARLKAIQGDFDGAIELQLSAIDLCRSIDLYTWLPLRYMELAQWYREIGNEDYARYYAELARKLLNQTDAEYPEWIARKSSELLGGFDEMSKSLLLVRVEDPAKTSPGHPASGAFRSTLDLQPKHVVSIPLESKPALGLFTLTNISEMAQSASLISFGQVDSIARNLSGDLTISLSPENESSETSFDLKLESSSQELLYVVAPAGTAPMDLKLKLDQTGTAPQEAHFSFPEHDQTTEISVSNASEILDNPYYMLSIFHVLQRMEGGPQEWVNLRFKASDPTRIEGYDGSGNLLFVDADGDGEFVSSGDLLHADADVDGWFDVVFGVGVESTSIEIMVMPEQRPEDGLLQIQVQRNQDGAWHTDAVDNIRFSE